MVSQHNHLMARSIDDVPCICLGVELAGDAQYCFKKLQQAIASQLTGACMHVVKTRLLYLTITLRWLVAGGAWPPEEAEMDGAATAVLPSVWDPAHRGSQGPSLPSTFL